MSNSIVKMNEAQRLAIDSFKVFSDYLMSHGEGLTDIDCTHIYTSLQFITNKIDAEKGFFMHLLDKTFAEKENLYQQAQYVLHKAIEVEDTEMVKVTSHFVEKVYNCNLGE